MTHEKAPPRLHPHAVIATQIQVASAQDKPAAQKWEYAMVKWDGPDRIQYILPDKFDLVNLGQKHALPKNAQAEEFFLTRAANELAKDGWEALNIDSRRILFRRPVK